MGLFERRAAYRYGRLKAPGKDGTTRWANPLYPGRIRSREFRRSMRGPSSPLVTLRTGYGPGARTVTVGAAELPLAQPTLPGTRAWHQAYGRRNLVETTNSALHGEFIEIDKGYVRTLRTGRVDTLTAHGLAGWNRWVIDRWNTFIALLEDPAFRPTRPRAPRRNRLPRYEDLTPRDTSPPG